jgi:hypothetical protein
MGPFLSTDPIDGIADRLPRATARPFALPLQGNDACTSLA